MIERYTLPEMGGIWTEDAKFQSWLDVEIAVCEAQSELGRVPAEALATIKDKAAFSRERILEIEAEVRHDVIAFLTNVNEHVGDAGRYIHVGMTSSDVLDTGLALQLKASVKLLRSELDKLAEAIRVQARAHKNTVMIGRSHAIHGEPITFGFKLAGWLAETERNIKRLKRLQKAVSVGQISGAMGNYANTEPQIEERACELLGLRPDPASTQVISRDRHADYVQTLALVGTPPWSASPPKFATCSAAMCSRWKRLLPRGKRAARPCPTSATRSAASASAAWRGCCAATPWQRWKTWRCGTSATSATARWSA